MGLAALIHANRGRAPGHRTPQELRERLIRLASDEYGEVNRAHLAELPAEREGIELPSARCGGSSPKPASAGPPATSSTSPQPARAGGAGGPLLEVDGSRHDWLDGRGTLLTLITGSSPAMGD